MTEMSESEADDGYEVAMTDAAVADLAVSDTVITECRVSIFPE
jgi:hypothetical protein